MSDIDYERCKTVPMMPSNRNHSTVVIYTILLHGGPCDGQRVGVSSDQSHVFISVSERPICHVWEINHVVKVGLYHGVQDVKK